MLILRDGRRGLQAQPRGDRRHRFLYEPMEPVRSLGVAAIVATYPDPRLRLTTDETAALVAEGDANLSSLRA